MLYVYIRNTPTKIQLSKWQEKTEVSFGNRIEWIDLEKYWFIKEEELSDFINNKIKGKQEEVNNYENSKAQDINVCENIYKTQMDHINNKFDKILWELNNDINTLKTLLTPKKENIQQLQTETVKEENLDWVDEEQDQNIQQPVGYKRQRRK